MNETRTENDPPEVAFNDGRWAFANNSQRVDFPPTQKDVYNLRDFLLIKETKTPQDKAFNEGVKQAAEDYLNSVP